MSNPDVCIVDVASTRVRDELGDGEVIAETGREFIELTLCEIYSGVLFLLLLLVALALRLHSLHPLQEEIQRCVEPSETGLRGRG